MESGRDFVAKMAALKGGVLDEATIFESVTRIAHLDTGQCNGVVDVGFPLLEYLRMDLLPHALPARGNRIWFQLEQDLRSNVEGARRGFRALGKIAHAKSIKDWEGEVHPVIRLCSQPGERHTLDTNPSIMLTVKFDPQGNLAKAHLSAKVKSIHEGGIQCNKAELTSEVARASISVPLRVIDPQLRGPGGPGR